MINQEFLTISLTLFTMMLAAIYFKRVWDDNKKYGYWWKPSSSTDSKKRGGK